MSDALDPSRPSSEPVRRTVPRGRRDERRDPRLVTLAEDSGYTIHERIGSGGMGIVYRGYDADGVAVAIKLLRHDISDDARARDRLAREVAAQQRLHSDNIVKVYDAELESADAFIVTEFVPGPTLEDAVEAHGPLHPEAVREIGLVVGETLQQIHGAGVIHRDLKPSNVMLRGAIEEDLVSFDPEGAGLDPVIIDFGIAMAAEESRMTSTGLVMGTASYLDPQVVRSNESGEAGDWWALAAMLAFAATGRPPYGSGRADLVFLRAERGELDVDGAPTELGDWLRSALRADPQERPEPAALLASLAELDLDRYDDPGETELLAADGRTRAFGAAGAGAAGAAALSGPAADAAAADGTADAWSKDQGSSGDRTELLAASEQEPRTEAFSAGDGQRTEAIPVHEEQRTEAIPVHRSSGHRDPEPGRDVESGRDVEPGTEVLPAIAEEPRTLVMPVIRSAPGEQAPPVGGDPYGTPQAYAQPAPVQHAPPQSYAAQQHYPPQQSYPSPQATPMPQAPWRPAPPPRRPLLVWTGHLILIALGAVAPYFALGLIILLGAMARTWDRSSRALEVRRARTGSSSAGTFAVGTAGPFRYLLALVEMALQVILPLVLGLLVGVAVDGIANLAGTVLPDGVVFGTAIGVTLLLVWVGLGSRTTRNGTHRLMDAAAPDRLWGSIVMGLLLLLLVAVVAAIVVRGGMVDYFPLGSWYRLEDLLPWR